MGKEKAMYIKHNGTLHNLSYYREIYKPKNEPKQIALETAIEVKYLEFKTEKLRDSAFDKITSLASFHKGYKLNIA